jgi:hypothetical protein
MGSANSIARQVRARVASLWMRALFSSRRRILNLSVATPSSEGVGRVEKLFGCWRHAFCSLDHRFKRRLGQIVGIKQQRAALGAP